MPDAARVSDPHTCPKIEPGPVPHVGGPILPSGSTNIDIEDLAAVRAGVDKCFCAVCSPDFITEGCGTVFFNDAPAVRKDDGTAHLGKIVSGSPTVEIGIPGDGIKVAVPKAAGGMMPPKKGKGEGGKGGAGDGEGDGADDGTGANDGDGNTPPADSPKTGVVHASFQIIDPTKLMWGATVEFECRSWDPDTGGTASSPNPEAIVARKWSAYIDGFGDLSVGSGDVHLEFPLYASGDIVNKRTLLMMSIDVQDTDGHKDNWGKGFWIEPAPTHPIPVITGHDRVMRDIFQHTLVPNAMLVVDGDQVSVFIAPVQDPRITGIELEVTIGEDLDTSQMANLPQATFQVSWQFNDAFNPTPVVVRARYVAENNTYSGWSNAYTRIQVLPHLGTSAGAWFASLILRLGFEAAVGFAFGGPAGALSSVAGYIVEQGLKDLGVNPVAAKILVGVFTVGSAGAAGVFGPNGVGEVRKIIPAVYQSELSKGIPKEMAWQRAMEVASHLQGTILKSAAAKAAIKESVDTLKGEIFKGGVEPE